MALELAGIHDFTKNNLRLQDGGPKTLTGGNGLGKGQKREEEEGTDSEA